MWQQHQKCQYEARAPVSYWGQRSSVMRSPQAPHQPACHTHICQNHIKFGRCVPLQSSALIDRWKVIQDWSGAFYWQTRGPTSVNTEPIAFCSAMVQDSLSIPLWPLIKPTHASLTLSLREIDTCTHASNAHSTLHLPLAHKVSLLKTCMAVFVLIVLSSRVMLRAQTHSVTPCW